MRRRPSKVAANYTGPDFSCYPGEHIKQDPENYLAGKILGLPLDGS